MAKSGSPRNAPCPCGSGKKYKFCCYQKDYTLIQASKKMVTLTLDDGEKITREVKAIDSIPTHNKMGLKPNITKDQMMDLCLDEIHKIIESSKVGMLADLVDTVIQKMDIVPNFTYREIGDRMEQDDRFEIRGTQICGLHGTDPLTLMVEKLSHLN